VAAAVVAAVAVAAAVVAAVAAVVEMVVVEWGAAAGICHYQVSEAEKHQTWEAETGRNHFWKAGAGRHLV